MPGALKQPGQAAEFAYVSVRITYPRVQMHTAASEHQEAHMAISLNDAAFEEFEQASNTAKELAERIAHCGRAGASSGEMVELLRAWQIARHRVRSSHERLLASRRSIGATAKRRTH